MWRVWFISNIFYRSIKCKKPHFSTEKIRKLTEQRFSANISVEQQLTGTENDPLTSFEHNDVEKKKKGN